MSDYSGKYERLPLEYFTSGNILHLRYFGVTGGWVCDTRVRKKVLRYDPSYSRI